MAGLTAGSIPVAADARTIKDAYTVHTELGDPGSDTILVTEQGIREAVDGVSAPTLDGLSDVTAITEARGQVIFYGDGAWDALDPGTGGYVLTTHGADSDPTWEAASGGGDLKADGTVPLTDDWDVGTHSITALTFTSDATTGTAPLAVASTTMVDNLNADLLDGYDAMAFAGAMHASDHETGGGDEVDADKADIDWDPSYYTPATTPAQADSVDNLAAHLYGIDQAIGTYRRVVSIEVFPYDTAVASGDGKFYWRVPAALNGYNLVGVYVYHPTASTSGATTTQIYNLTDTADMLSTAITVDQDENDSLTAVTPAVIDTDHDDVATGDVIRIDVDGAGTGTKGLQLGMEFQLP